MKNIPYASAVGSLMYAQVCTRPDIAFVVGMLGRYQSDPGMDHWRAAKKVMRYLQKTKNNLLIYRRIDKLEVVGYTNSDFAGCQDSMKSTLGFIFMMAGGEISWKSIKQTLTVSSTMEAEFIACHALWLRNFISRLMVVDSISKPLMIFYDNSAVVMYSRNNKSSGKSRYIDIKYFVVKERIQNQLVSIEHISTQQMIADPITKGLSPKLYSEHVAHMGIIDSFDLLR
ncbi:secreted RxLR effector protein 161-like [Cornus florida]|uniref:secreted RxLR effector protein 161-like n=1 Tax=Cornus florida TaxID=4283 RepID=UPI0028974536|nr:secreted RxLR effector protein 161-like [Cornus florida]